MKRITGIVLCILLQVISISFANPPRESYHIKTVVIDPGHGGHDSGCLGSSAKEKFVALDIALKLGKLIEQSFPDMKVIFTRKTDVFIPLHERAEIANRNHADLFICVHLNSGNKVALGAETYVMGLHKTEDNLNVAKRENASILLEDNYKKEYDGFDPNSPEANIIFSLYQNQFMHQSLSFASKIQDEFEEYAGRNNRGVKQAGFLVLYKTAMPAVLIESGFLTHDGEEKYLNSDKGQSTVATSIFRAFKEYKIDMENSRGEKSDIDKDEASPKSSELQKADAVKKIPEEKKDVPIPVHNTVLDTEYETLTEQKPQVQVKEPQPVKTKEQKSPVKKETIDFNNTSSDSDNQVYYTIQIGASTNPSKDKTVFLKNKDVKAVKCDDGYTRYVIGNFKSSAEAKKQIASVKSSGYKDAYVTAISGNKRITMAEAEQVLKRK